MFARNINHRLLMIGVCVALSLFGATSCGYLFPPKITAGLDSETRGVLENGINELGNQPGRWQETMNSVIDELGKVGTESAKKVLAEVQAVYSSMLAQSMGMLGTAAKCQTDFFGIRAEQKLRAIIHKFDPQTPGPTIVPFICNFDPNEVHASKDPAKKTRIVHYYGFDFMDFENRYRADLEYDSGEIIQKGFGSVGVQSNYELSVEFQAANYDNVDFSRHPQLILMWNEEPVGPPKMKSTLALLNVDLPEPAPPPPAPSYPSPPGPGVNIPPGLTVGLRHTDYLKSNFVGPADLGFLNVGPASHWCCYDKGESSGQGFDWWTVPDKPGADPSNWKLPPGVVVGLRHTNQGDAGVTAFGHNATQEGNFADFSKMWGSDCCGNDYPFGFSWYVSNGSNFNWAADQAWADHLPQGTVVGLKQKFRNSDYSFTWGTANYNATDKNGPTPPGYVRICTTDDGAGSDSLCWFEKTWGVAVVLQQNSSAGVLGAGLELNTDRGGANYSYFGLEGDDPRVCQAYCYGDLACRAWTFVHPNVRGPKAECWLKGAVPAPTLNNSSCVSGVTVGQ